MLVVQLLLDTDVVREGVVERSRHVRRLHVCPAVGQSSREGPTVRTQASIISVLPAYRIITVCKGNSRILSSCHMAGAEIEVVRATHARHGEVVKLEWQRSLLASVGNTVQAAYQRITELSTFQVIHGNALDVTLIVLLVKSTVTETSGTKEKTYR